MTALAKSNGWSIEAVFAEKVSGAKVNSARTELLNMISYVEANHIDKVLVTELSRLGRDTLQVLEVIQLLNDKGISLYIQNYNIETLTKDGKVNAMSQFLITILAEVARMERKTIRERVESGYKNYRANGGKYTYYNCSHNASHLRTKAKETNEAFAKYLACLKPNETVLELYHEVLKDLQQDTKKERKHEADKLAEELNKVAEKMAKLEYKFIEGDIEKSEYNRIMDRYRKVALDLEKQIDVLRTPSRSKIEPKLDYSINLINNIDNYIRNAQVEVKIKLIGSMFHEKIEFDETDYRTNSYNKVLDLIY